MSVAPSGVELGPGCTWRPSRWERNAVTYGALSYGLWLRHAAYDLAGRKPKKRILKKV